MADAPISGLPETSVMGDNDLLLLEQSSTAKKIKGRGLKQYFNANVVSASASTVQPSVAPSATYNPSTNNLNLNLPSADYIVSIEKTGTSGRIDTYTVITALGYTATFDVVNGDGATADDTGAIALDGHQSNINPVNDLNNFKTGIALFNPNPSSGTAPSHMPSNDSWWLVVSSGGGTDTAVQVAYSLNNDRRPQMRSQAVGTWSVWSEVSDVQTPNPNILDNAWFTINQRSDGGNYWTNTDGEFLVDRWRLYNPYGGAASWSPSWHGITLNANDITGTGERFVQVTQTIPSNVIASILQKTVTFSYSYAGIGKTVTMPSSVTATIELGRIAFADNSGYLIFGVNANGTGWMIIRAMAGHTVNIDRVKLEVGSYSTLYWDAYPDYATELLKCQRYLYMFPAITEDGFVLPILFGQAISTSQIRFYIKNPTKFYTTPSIREYGNAVYHLYKADGGTEQAISSFQIIRTADNVEAVCFGVNGDGHYSTNAIYCLQAHGKGSFGGLLFSCEI